MEYKNWQKYYPEFLYTNRIEIVSGNIYDLLKLLGTSRWQVGSYSTALFLGIALKCCTFLADIPGVEHLDKMQKYLKLPKVRKASDIDLEYRGFLSSPSLIFADEWESRFLNGLTQAKYENFH